MPNVFKSVTVDIELDTSVYTCPAGTTTIVIGMRLGNKTQVDQWVTVALDKGGLGTNIQPIVSAETPIPIGGALEGMQGSKLVLEPGDVLTATASAVDAVGAVLSVMEQT